MVQSATTNALEQNSRTHLMRICSAATKAELQVAVEPLVGTETITVLRPPETGLAMVRGRAGGTGAAFNLGEATVTRATVRLSSGETGHSYLLGRVPARAHLSAIVDALGQRRKARAALEATLVAAVEKRLMKERATHRTETDRTKVDFFTLVRGEN